MTQESIAGIKLQAYFLRSSMTDLEHFGLKVLHIILTQQESLRI